MVSFQYESRLLILHTDILSFILGNESPLCISWWEDASPVNQVPPQQSQGTKVRLLMALVPYVATRFLCYNLGEVRVFCFPKGALVQAHLSSSG